MTQITKSQCYRVQEFLRKGEAWTRQVWIDKEIFKDKYPRIILTRIYGGFLGRATLRKGPNDIPYRDDFIQIWYGDEGEPSLNMFPYSLSEEDYEATDWLQVDKCGVRTGVDFLLWEYIGDLSQDLLECSYNQGDIREMWNSGTLDSDAAWILKQYPKRLERYQCANGKYSDLLTRMVKVFGGWPCHYGTAVFPLTAKEQTMVDALK